MKYVRRNHVLFMAMGLMVASFFAALIFTYGAQAADCVGVQTSVVDCDAANDTTGSPVVAILVIVIRILTAVIGVVAVGGLVYAGILYASASGDSSQINKAKEIIRNIVIGLIAFALMAGALNWLIPGGLFSGNAKFGAGGNGFSNITAKNLVIKNEDDKWSLLLEPYCWLPKRQRVPYRQQ
jgi:hypothetical protein